MANFICEDTGKEFTISQYSSTVSSDGSIIYKDRWGKEIVNPETKKPLKLIPKEGLCTNFLMSTKDRADRNAKHFKKRARDHANTDDAKHEKQKAKDREMGNMGYERKK